MLVGAVVVFGERETVHYTARLDMVHDLIASGLQGRLPGMMGFDCVVLKIMRVNPNGGLIPTSSWVDLPVPREDKPLPGPQGICGLNCGVCRKKKRGGA